MKQIVVKVVACSQSEKIFASLGTLFAKEFNFKIAQICVQCYRHYSRLFRNVSSDFSRVVLNFVLKVRSSFKVNLVKFNLFLCRNIESRMFTFLGAGTEIQPGWNFAEFQPLKNVNIRDSIFPLRLIQTEF